MRPNLTFPALLELGPVVVWKADKLRCFRVIARAYREGATSLRKAHLLSCRNASEWGFDENLVENWRRFQEAAFEAENLFQGFFGTKIHLFIKLGEGMPWIGLTEWASQADELAGEFLTWYDHPQSPP